jgi:phage tail sheath protein FI
MDTLQDAHINPIVAFPGSPGNVVWGQKTLQAAASALDRVNVRRLLIDVRRQVRRVADGFTFEPNRDTTLKKFSDRINPLLQRVQEQQGLDKFKVLIDTTTTTQVDVDNNTIRGKIFLQPTQTAETVSLDFVLSNLGAEV